MSDPVAVSTVETGIKDKLAANIEANGFVSQQHQLNLLIRSIAEQMVELKAEILRETIPK